MKRRRRILYEESYRAGTSVNAATLMKLTHLNDDRRGVVFDADMLKAGECTLDGQACSFVDMRIYFKPV